MQTFSITGLLLSYVFTLLSCEIMADKALQSSIAQFSAKFCNELDKTKSVVSSPLSAEFVLALLALGTSEPAHQELLTTLGFADDATIRSSFTEVSSKLKSIKGVTLDVANKVYINKGGYYLQPELEEDAVKVFDAAFEMVNFNDGAAAADLINKWVENKTNERIKDLLPSDCLNSDTRIVLVNALYFKGTWKKQFDATRTKDEPFHIDEDKTVQVPMMYQQETFEYGESEELGAQLLKMQYVGENASMLIILPNEINGLSGVLKKLADGFDLMGETEKMFYTKVHVTIPKFKIETEIDLGELLPKLGIKAIFNLSNSGLTKILNTTETLFVSKAVQKAFIEVNEEGAEAAAATAMGIMFCSAFLNPPPVPRFVADRPFLTIILVEKTPYFMAMHRGDS